MRAFADFDKYYGLRDTPALGELAKLGVARISYGPAPYRQMTAALKEAGRRAFADLS